jgi:hypothetical protein
MDKISISKKLQPKYIKGETCKILNYENGRGIDVTFKSKEDYSSQADGMEYLMVLEQYLNDRGIQFEAFNYFVMANVASVMLIVKSDLEVFNAAYVDFKEQHIALMEYYKNEAQKLNEDMEKSENNDYDVYELVNEDNQITETSNFKNMDDAIEALNKVDWLLDGNYRVVNTATKEEVKIKVKNLKVVKEETHKIENAEKFIFAGNAIFTLESEKTGNRYTYKVNKCEDKKDFYFVGLLVGPDNEYDYKYIGVIDKNNFRTTKASKLTNNSTPVIAFNFFLKKMNKLNAIPELKIYHMGKCAKCGRPLTTPESIKNGLGPICMGLM